MPKNHGVYRMYKKVKVTLENFINSWTKKETNFCTVESVIEWVETIKSKTIVNVNIVPLDECHGWFYDSGTGSIHNYSNSFFDIRGIATQTDDDYFINQPIIFQPEIGYLGIISKIIDDTIYFLMQAKIEPGNINVVQISPTIQATKSNFEKKHGGSEPPYLQYFKSVKNDDIIVDQIQSEQSSRFYKKRNRNIIILA